MTLVVVKAYTGVSRLRVHALRALWSLSNGIEGILECSWGLLAVARTTS